MVPGFLNPAFFETGENHDPVSLLFGGPGDGRNVFTVFREMAMVQSEINRPGMDAVPIIRKMKHKTFHFTCVDIKDNSNQIEAENLSATLFYLFVAPIMPRRMYDLFQSYVRRAIGIYASNERVPRWLCVYERDRADVLAALRSWQDESLEFWPTKQVRRLSVEGSHRRELNRKAETPECKADEMLFALTGVLQPPTRGLEQDEPSLKLLIDKLVRSKSKQRQIVIAREICDYADSAWMTNILVMDNERPTNLSPLLEDPFEQVVHKLWHNGPVPGATHTYDYAAQAFESFANGFKFLRRRCCIELAVSDVCQHMEELQFLETTSHRSSAAITQKDVRKFPRRFDVIHLSNIP